MDIPASWERVVWSGRSWRAPRTRYRLTDLRLVRRDGAAERELALYDIGDVVLTRSRWQRWIGTATITVSARQARRLSIEIADIRRAAQLAAVLELVAADSGTARNHADLRATLRWTPVNRRPRRTALAVAAIAALAALAAVLARDRTPTPVVFAADDAIAPGGVKHTEDDIVRYMETAVMPWARTALGPIVGGPERVTCETCHGGAARARAWQMPAVAVLPRPVVRRLGWETYSAGMDPQIRNAIYGYAAESDKQSKATYMREVVMPGMARLLHRPAYDFTRPYEYNRTRRAFGCYHCHRVK